MLCLAVAGDGGVITSTGGSVLNKLEDRTRTEWDIAGPVFLSVSIILVLGIIVITVIAYV